MKTLKSLALIAGLAAITFSAVAQEKNNMTPDQMAQKQTERIKQECYRNNFRPGIEDTCSGAGICTGCAGCAQQQWWRPSGNEKQNATFACKQGCKN